MAEQLRDQIKESMKRTKASVDYSEGAPAAHCGICEYYNGKMGPFIVGDLKKNFRSCSKVKGTIEPSMWCELWHHVET